MERRGKQSRVVNIALKMANYWFTFEHTWRHGTDVQLSDRVSAVGRIVLKLLRHGPQNLPHIDPLLQQFPTTVTINYNGEMLKQIGATSL